MRFAPWLCALPFAFFACGEDEVAMVPSDATADAGPVPVPAAFGLDVRPPNPTCVAPSRPVDVAEVDLQDAFPIPFAIPLDMRQPPGEPTRWYIAERAGVLKAFTVGDTTAQVAFTIPNVNTTQEGGFLGFAFHPSWPAKKEVYLSYTTTSATSPVNMRSVIARIRSTDGVVFDPGSLEEILTLDQPFTNHNGGGVGFGPDGFLYAGFGDGGSGGDPKKNGQNVNTLHGKFIRIDVNQTSGALQYAIPPTNPFAMGGGAPEIYAIGLRNPWRWSFDIATGDLWAADVGQSAREEIDLIKLGGNYGWSVREGKICYGAATCPTLGFVDPVLDYPRTDINGVQGGTSVTGGYVYRGTAIPGLIGKYVFGDYGNGRIWRLEDDGRTAATKTQIGSLPSIAMFGQDLSGEIYVSSIAGSIIKKLVPKVAPVPSTFPQTLSATGCVDPANPKRMVAGAIPYAPTATLWSDGAEKERFLAVPDGATITIGADGDWDFPKGSVLIKTFSLMGKRIETRLYMRHADGVWSGYSYAWNDAETDATLLPSSTVRRVGTQDWTYPSRAQCNQCHTTAAGYSLGLETAQLNADFVYASTNRKANQLNTLDHLGLFTRSPGASSALPRYPSPFGSESLESRARAYLHANCSSCHRPQGGARGELDLRYDTAFADTKTCGRTSAIDDLGNPANQIVAPGSPDTSILYQRMISLDVSRMPQIGSALVDPEGALLIKSWIASLATCPP